MRPPCCFLPNTPLPASLSSPGRQSTTLRGACELSIEAVKATTAPSEYTCRCAVSPVCCGRTPGGRWCSRWTCPNSSARLRSSRSWAAFLPISAGICFRRCPTMSMWMRSARTLLQNSFTCVQQAVRADQKTQRLLRVASSLCNSLLLCDGSQVCTSCDNTYRGRPRCNVCHTG